MTQICKGIGRGEIDVGMHEMPANRDQKVQGDYCRQKIHLDTELQGLSARLEVKREKQCSRPSLY